MARVDPTPVQKERLLNANAYKCCVCKRSGVGFNFHHLDGDSSNTIDSNLAVLCVEDHDRHHRPGKYGTKVNHLELGEQELLRLKKSWEEFVLEARKPNPTVLATLASYGTEELIHSLQLVLQWPDERIEYKRSYHLLDSNMDLMTDRVFEELATIGTGIKLALINEPLPIDHCPCCGSGFSRTMKPAVVARLTDPDWSKNSACSIYINPHQPSLAFCFSLLEKELFSGSLHLCNGTHLHLNTDVIDESIAIKPHPSIRSQVTRIIEGIFSEWQPAHIFMGTGPHENPTSIEKFTLPKIWEKSHLKNATSNQSNKRRK